MKNIYLPCKIPSEIPKWMYLVRGFVEIVQGLYDIAVFPFGRQGGWILMHWQGRMFRAMRKGEK